MYAKNSMSLFRFGAYISAQNPTTMMRRILQRIQRELYNSLLIWEFTQKISSSLLKYLRICANNIFNSVVRLCYPKSLLGISAHVRKNLPRLY